MKRKINEKLLSCLIVFAALFAFSCKGISDSNEEIEPEKPATEATLRLYAETKDVRTALPSIQIEDFTDFTLYAVKINDGSAAGEYAELKKWTDSAKMQADVIELSVGIWNFKLNAKKGQAEYEKCLEAINIHSGENRLDFVLDLKSTGSEGKGSINITVMLANGLSPYYKVEFSPADSDEVISRKNGQVEQAAGQNSVSALNLSFTDVSAGSYKISLDFYSDSAKTLLIGHALEYAHVISGITSYSTVHLGSLDQTYSIKYFKGTNELAGLGAGNYTRHNPLELPDASQVLPDDSTEYFCGWYENPLLTGSSVQTIPRFTVGNKEFYGKFVSRKSYAPIQQILIQGDKETGSTLSAVPYISQNENPDENDVFTGEIESYQWFRGLESENQIEWTPVSTEETYRLTPSDVGKYIKVEITQKYIAQFDQQKGIYVINQNQDSLSSDQTSASGLVQKGSLNQQSLNALIHNQDFELIYNNNSPVLLGSILDSQRIEASADVLLVHDENGNNVEITFAFNQNQAAPENGSNYLPLIVKADGYDDVLLPASEKLLFVYEKANPVSSETLASLLSTNVNRIPKGSIAFAQLNSAIEFSIDGGTRWNNITTESFVKPESLSVRIKEVAVSSDEKANPVGFIEYSEASQVIISSLNVGTLVIVTSALINVTTPENGALSYGNTVTALPVYSEAQHIYNQEIDGVLTYKWFYESEETENGWQQITGANLPTYLIAETSALGKKLKVEITQSHPNELTYRANGISSANVEKGSLFAESSQLSYADSVVIVGEELEISKISSTVFTNQAGSQVSPSLEFVNPLVPEGACSVNAKAVLAGYNDLALTVTLSSVKAAIPTADYFESSLSAQTESIPKNYIRFTQEAAANHLLYSTDGETFTAAQANQEIQITNTFYLKVAAYDGENGSVLASDVSENLYSSLADYLGLCNIRTSGQNSISFSELEIRLTYSNNVVTADLPAGITITGWEIPDGSLSDIATISADKKTVTFTNNAVAGTYYVTVWAVRNGNILSSTCTVVLEDSDN